VDFYFQDSGIYSAGDYDFAKEVAAMAIVKEVVDRRGGWIYHGERKWQGQEAFVASLREEVDLVSELRARVLEVSNTPIGG
jgi:hypothetical protein